MKTLRTTLSISFILLLLLNFTSCKKDKTEVTPITTVTPSTTVTADDLLAYNIVAIIGDNTNKQQLRLFYFSKVGNEVTATLDGVTSRRAQIIKLVNNTFTFDTNGDGQIVYTITLKKDNTGELTASTYNYVNLITPTYKIQAAVVSKLTDLPSVKNKSFKSDNDNVVITFFTDTWTRSANPNPPESFYEISSGAWKGRLGGQDYMGTSLLDINHKLFIYVQQGENIIRYGLQ